MSQVAQRLGYHYGSTSLRKAFCITSYFRKPEQGVHNWEELSRSSAFLVRSKNHFQKFHVLSAAHVSHPFLFPKLYPEEFPRFLSFLKESDVKVMLQLRQLEFGGLLAEFELKKALHVKVEADLVVGHLADEARFEEILKNDFSYNVQPLTLLREAMQPHTEVELLGHDFSVNGNGQPVLVPVSLPGYILGSSNKRVIVETPQPSVMGLCGGPVLVIKDGITTEDVAGMVEGRIQSKPGSIDSDEDISMKKALVDRTVLVSSQEMANFVDQLEAELEQHQEPITSPPGTAKMTIPELTIDSIYEPFEAEGGEQEPPKIVNWNPNQKSLKDDDVDF